MEVIAGLCTHPSRGCTSGGRAKGRERRREPCEPSQGSLSLSAHPWELVLVSVSIPFGASSFQRLNSPSLRKEKNHWVPTFDSENKLLFNTKWEKEVRVVVLPDWGGEETGEAPGRGCGAGALPRRQAAGRDPLRSAPLRSWGCTAPSPAAAASPRPARLAPHEACSKRAARAAPRQLPRPPLIAGDSDGQQSRDTQCWLPGGDQSSVWSVFKQDGLGRALPAPPPAPPTLAVSLVWLLLGSVCAGQSEGRDEEKSVLGPVGAAGFGGADSWRRLPFVVSFIHKC